MDLTLIYYRFPPSKLNSDEGLFIFFSITILCER